MGLLYTDSIGWRGAGRARVEYNDLRRPHKSGVYEIFGEAERGGILYRFWGENRKVEHKIKRKF